MRSLTVLVAVIALSLGVFATPALAGGWAVTTFDSLPSEFVAGRDYALGYTIRQHGQTPVNVDKTEVVAVATSGRTLSFSGKSQGAVGHYVAAVYFPAGGAYTWHVTQGAFAPQDLGPLTVMGAAGAPATDKDKAAAGKALPADKAAADKAAAPDKAAMADKAVSADRAAAADKAAVAKPDSDTASAPASQSDPIRTALPFAAAAAAAMFVWRLATMLRTARRTRATV
jgi:hypothetical protein